MNVTKRIACLIALTALLLPPSLVCAHEAEEELNDEGGEIVEPVPTQEVPTQINREYVSRIRPIFGKKCFDCHSNQTRYPWYYKIPGIKQLIDHDIRAAKRHVDMTNDFPFKGHGTPRKDLEAIREVVTEGDMPPWDYRLMHPESGLSSEEKAAVLKWTDEAHELLTP